MEKILKAYSVNEKELHQEYFPGNYAIFLEHFWVRSYKYCRLEYYYFVFARQKKYSENELDIFDSAKKVLSLAQNSPSLLMNDI